MFGPSAWLLLAAILTVHAAVIQPGSAARSLRIRPACACIQTIPRHPAPEIQARQETCPPAPTPVTVTETITAWYANPLATVLEEDPSSVASYLNSVAGIDTIIIENSSQDRPINQPFETTAQLFTHTASAPAIIASDDPNDDTVLYRIIGTTSAAAATAVVSFAPIGSKPTSAGSVSEASTTDVDSDDPDSDVIITATVITYASTVTVNVAAGITPASNLSVVPMLQKKQICSMVYAKIDGEWTSWCNNWDGSSIISHISYTSTVQITHPVGASPIPESVYNHGSLYAISSLTSSESAGATSTSIPSSLLGYPEEPTSTSTPVLVPEAPQSVSSTSSSTVSIASQAAAEPTSTSTPISLPGVQTFHGNSTASRTYRPIISSIPVTATITLTLPVTTIVRTNSASSSSNPETSSSCGQTGRFVVTFDDLPVYSTRNPNETASPPIFDPYDHLYWASGYSYGPPPSIPYMPHDGSRLAIYDPLDAVEAPTATTQGRFLPGSFGAGPRVASSVFWFDAQSVYIGCNNTVSKVACDITATGYQWVADPTTNTSAVAGHEVMVVAQHYAAPSMCAEQPCTLSQISFDPAKFSGLSSLKLEAKVDGTVVGFFFDTFEASWSNGTCEAGLERQSSRK